jgi:rhodanese-related sulfurtransferase
MSVQKDNDKPSYTEAIEELASICHQIHPDAPWLSLSEFLHQSERDEWVIVDVRSKRERDVSIIPGALSDKEFEAQEAQVEEDDRHILVYCTAGCRSARYAQKLLKQGLKAFNLRGGILAWALEGRTFVTPSGEVTRQAHVYSGEWNVLPPGYEAIL